jgi:hypothetical protein
MHNSRVSLIVVFAVALTACGAPSVDGDTTSQAPAAPAVASVPTTAAVAPSVPGGTATTPTTPTTTTTTATTTTPPAPPPATPGVNTAPTLSGAPPTTVVVGSEYSFLPTAADVDGDALTFAIVNKPAWLNFNSRTGLISGTPAAGDVGLHADISIGVSDGKANSALSAFNIQVSAAPAVASIVNPILFVTQVPTLNDFAARATTFANHLANVDRVVRGGDLMIRYPDGSVRNLTKEAGFGMDGLQSSSAIAVREPSVHWDGTRALFSMVIGGASRQYQDGGPHYWQIYEVSGLGKGEAVSIRKIAGQPLYNNISPIYGTDDRIIFTSDRPRGGEAHLYPQLDEYESTPTVSGIWSMTVQGADLRLVNHAISGAFSPTVDSAGRLVYTRWDHLQQDQQADADRAGGGNHGSFNLASEAAGAARTGLPAEVFPEPRAQSSSPYGPVLGYTFNLFQPWQVNEDGTEEETLNHVGRQEFSFGYLGRSFLNDPSLNDVVIDSLRSNRKYIRIDGGLFQIRENPLSPGEYFAIYAREFGSLSSDQIVKFNAPLNGDPSLLRVTDVTVPANGDLSITGGRFRNPLPLRNGSLLASHTPTTAADPSQMREFRLRSLISDGSGLMRADQYLTPGIRKAVSWWDPDTQRSFDGLLWELEAVEVVARPRPATRVSIMPTVERTVFTEEGVDEAAFRNWLKTRELALIVTRDQTSRDRADRQQPFNLQVPGGIRKVGAVSGPVYDISHFQILQADMVRGYTIKPGRRALALPAKLTGNPANPGGPVSSVKIAADGSTAAIVPARRALAWQTTDSAGVPIVRERVWVTFQPGEIRVCGSCHGVNSTDQAGNAPPENKPEALRALLRYWKTLAP